MNNLSSWCGLVDAKIRASDACKVKISQNFMAFSEYMNFIEKNINPRFIYIMYGLRYLSIVTSKFVKIALGLTWITSILWAASSYFAFDEKVIQKKKTFMKMKKNKVLDLVSKQEEYFRF